MRDGSRCELPNVPERTLVRRVSKEDRHYHCFQNEDHDLPIYVHQSVLFSARGIIRMFVDMAGIAYRLRVLKWYQKNAGNRRARYKPIIRW